MQAIKAEGASSAGSGQGCARDVETKVETRQEMQAIKAEGASSAGSGQGCGTGASVGVQPLTITAGDSSDDEEHKVEKKVPEPEIEVPEDEIAEEDLPLRFQNKMRNTQGMLRILISYMQVLALLQVALPTVPWPNVFTGMNSVFKFAVFDFAAFVPLQCHFSKSANFYTAFITSLVMPPILCTVVYIPMRFRAQKKYKEYKELADDNKTLSAEKALQAFENAKNGCFRGVLGVLFLLYPVVSLKIMSVFNCRFIEDGWYLVDDVSILCFDDETHHTFASVAAVFFWVYPVGIPLSAYIILSRNRHKLHREKVWYRFGFLYENYKDEHWFEEPLEAVRKLILTSAIMFFLPGSSLQVGFSMVIAFCYMVYQFKCRPYFEECQNRMQIFYQLGITLTLFSGSMLKGFKCNPELCLGNEEITFWEVILVGTNVVIGSYMLYCLIVMGLLSTGVNYVKEFQTAKAKQKKRLNLLENANLMLAAEAPPAAEPIKTEQPKVPEAPRVPCTTFLVDIQTLLDKVDLDGLVRDHMNSDTMQDTAKRGKVRGPCFEPEENDAFVARIRESMLWFFDDFESQRTRLTDFKSSNTFSTKWPPNTVEGLRKCREAINDALIAADLAELKRRMQEECLSESFEVLQKKFPQYCQEVMQIKSQLRDGIKLVVQTALERGIQMFRNDLDQILLHSKEQIESETLDAEISISVKEAFARVTCDGETLATEEEFQNVVTAIEYKFSEFITPPENQEEIYQKAIHKLEKDPMSFSSFVKWFDYHFRNIGEVPDEVISALSTFGVPLTDDMDDDTTLGTTHIGTGTSYASRLRDKSASKGASNNESVSKVSASEKTEGGQTTATGSNRISAARNRLATALAKKKSTALTQDDALSEKDATTTATSTAALKSNAAKMLLEKRRQRAAEKEKQSQAGD